MHRKVSGASSIFNLRSRPVSDPIPAYWIQYPSIQLQYRSRSKNKDPLEGTTLETLEGPNVLYFPYKTHSIIGSLGVLGTVRPEGPEVLYCP